MPRRSKGSRGSRVGFSKGITSTRSFGCAAANPEPRTRNQNWNPNRNWNRNRNAMLFLLQRHMHRNDAARVTDALAGVNPHLPAYADEGKQVREGG